MRLYPISTKNLGYNITMKKELEEIVNILKNKNETITMAESCTGGRVAAAFTSIAGVSSVFDGAVVTYANEIKEEWLGVSREILSEHGAVSKECVDQMLSGAIKMSHANHSIAISGVAGPDGGTPDKPVGTVYIGVLVNGVKTIQKYHFEGDREDIQDSATKKSIELFLKKIKKN